MSQPKMSLARRRMISGLTPAARADTNKDDSIVPCARASRISMGVDTRRGKSFSAARDRQDFGLAYTTLQRLQGAFVMNEFDCVARSKLVKAFLHARQIPNEREIGEVQLQLSEDPIQGVVAGALTNSTVSPSGCGIGGGAISSISIIGASTSANARAGVLGGLTEDGLAGDSVDDCAADQRRQQTGDKPARVRRRERGLVCSRSLFLTPRTLRQISSLNWGAT